MPELVFKVPVPADKVDGFVLAFASNHGWLPFANDENGDEIPNPVTPLQHVRNTLNRFIADGVSNYMAQEAGEAARKATLEAVQTDLGGIVSELIVEE